MGAEESEAVTDDHGLMGAAVKAKAKIKATIVKGIPNIWFSARQETEPDANWHRAAEKYVRDLPFARWMSHSAGSFF